MDLDFAFGKLVSGSADKTLRIWDLSNHKCVGVLDGHSGWVRACQISGYNVLSGSGDCTVKLWDISKLESVNSLPEEDDIDPLSRTFYGHTGGVTCVQFDETVVLSGSLDKTVIQWDLETGASITTLKAHVSLDSLISPIDKIIYSDTYNQKTLDSSIDLSEHENFDWGKLQEPEAPKVANVAGHVGCLFFFKYALAAGYGDGIIRLYDLRTGECHRSLTGHSSTVTSVRFDDNMIISGSMDKTVKV